MVTRIHNYITKILRPDSAEAAKQRVMLSILFILIISSLIFFSVGLYFQKKYMDQSLQKFSGQLRATLYQALDLENSRYTYLAQRILQDRRIINNFRPEKRKKLYELLKPIYDNLAAKDEHLFVMHLHSPNNRTLLRIHRPDIYDDDLGKIRPLVAEANQRRHFMNGFELGKNGIYFRVITPVFNGKEYLGLLEFGYKVDFITQSLSKMELYKFGIFASNEYMKKNQLVYKLPDRFRFGKYLLIASNDPLFKTLPQNIEILEKYQMIKSNGRHYGLYGGHFLLDFRKEIIGVIMIASDMTKLIWDFYQIVAYITVVVILFLFLSLFKHELRVQLFAA